MLMMPATCVVLANPDAHEEVNWEWPDDADWEAMLMILMLLALCRYFRRGAAVAATCWRLQAGVQLGCG